MAHLLLIELPGADDTDIIDALIDGGHSFSFLTGDLACYQEKPDIMRSIARARSLLEIPGFDEVAVDSAVLAEHARQPIQGVLCLVDIRIIDASRLAHRLSLPFLNPDSARLLRDKHAVRQRLQAHGLAQPEYRLATDNQQLRSAAETLGVPVIIKPTDGYGSQNVILLQDTEDLNPLLTPVDNFLPQRLDYGFGIWANDRLLVERFIPGTMIGCDTISFNGHHQCLGINEKQYFPRPAFAIRGSCFPSERFDDAIIQAYVSRTLDAVGFDWGMAHIELVMSDNGPMLVEINPRLVGAKIPRLLNLAFQRSIHADLIDLHLGQRPDIPRKASQYAVSRWFAAPHAGTLASISPPANISRSVKHYEMVKRPGSIVRPPQHNGDRIGYVMTSSDSIDIAEAAADTFIGGCELIIEADG